MELKTKAVDRLLEALSPALGAELDRIAQDIQLRLEEDFEIRVQAAVREAEAATQRMAEVQLQQALGEVREQVRRQVTDELQAQFANTLEENTARLRAEWDAERARLAEQLEESRTFADAHRQLGEASSQPEMLIRFLNLAERYAPSIAVYIARPDGLALWKARGQAVFPQIISDKTADPELFFRKIIVRDKLIAAIYAAQPCKLEGLSFLAATLERAIELFGLKLRVPPPVPKAAAAQPAVSAQSAVAAAVPMAAASAVVPVAAAAPVDEKAHAEARQLARLLVSEIKLYNEDDVRSGRANCDLYSRLQSQIEASREQYRQRAPAAALFGADYFHEEVVRILAENDESLLGARYPGSAK
jgi:hypothetical protein